MIGSAEIFLILGVTTLLFGGKKLPEFARNLGKGLREFKRAANGDPSEDLDSGVVDVHVEPENKK